MEVIMLRVSEHRTAFLHTQEEISFYMSLMYPECSICGEQYKRIAGLPDKGVCVECFERRYDDSYDD